MADAKSHLVLIRQKLKNMLEESQRGEAGDVAAIDRRVDALIALTRDIVDLLLPIAPAGTLAPSAIEVAARVPLRSVPIVTIGVTHLYNGWDTNDARIAEAFGWCIDENDDNTLNISPDDDSEARHPDPDGQARKFIAMYDVPNDLPELTSMGPIGLIRRAVKLVDDSVKAVRAEQAREALGADQLDSRELLRRAIAAAEVANTALLAVPRDLVSDETRAWANHIPHRLRAAFDGLGEEG